MGKINSKTIKEYLMVGIGTLIVAFSAYYFFAPENLVCGGVTGFSIMMGDVLDLPISNISLVCNIVLLVLGFIFIGFEFGGKTIFATILFSGFLYVMENVAPCAAPVTDSTFVNLTVAALLCGLGLSIVFNQNASTGGTDILAMIFKKFFNLEIGTGMLLADAIVVILAMFYYGVSAGVYGALGWFITGAAINYFSDGFNVKKEITIITNKTDECKDYILNQVDRGVTIYKAEGGYSKSSKEIIVTVCKNKEYFKLKKELKKIDPGVFVIVRNVHEAIGEGFVSLDS